MKLFSEVINPIIDLGYEIKIVKLQGDTKFLWKVSDYGRLIFSGSYDEFIQFRQTIINNVALIA